MSAIKKLNYTLQEYFDLEFESNERFEYWNGEIFKLSGGSLEHETIIGNFFKHLSNKTENSNCRIFTSNMRIKVPSAPPYRYADLSGLCGKIELEKIGGVDSLTNPNLLIEVLSESTEAYDRGEKFSFYKSIQSLSEYILIDQKQPFITQFVKQSDGKWLQSENRNIEEKFFLTSLNVEISLDEIYQNIEFKELTTPFSHLRLIVTED